MPYDAKAVANYLLDLAKEEGVAVTPLQLQKLAYFAHGWHLALTGEPLINEQIQAWEYGPVIYSLYDEFRDLGNEPIDRPALAIQLGPGRAPRTMNLDELDFLQYAPALDDNPTGNKEFVERLLKRVWELYGRYSPLELSNMTHQSGTPWDQVSRQYHGDIPKFTPIPQEAIKSYFKAFLEKPDEQPARR
jgi:uncharacterized phage-associated protein